MKKIFLLLTVLLLAVSAVTAQESDKKAQREARKEAQKKADALLAEEAFQAVENRSFALEIDKVTFRNGKSAFVIPRRNFIVLDHDNAIVQLSSDAGFYSPNGIGGITVEGIPTNITLTTDKKGNHNLSMSVQGIGISAQVSINVPKDGSRGIATVVPNYNPYRIILKGTIYPLHKANLFKGKTL